MKKIALAAFSATAMIALSACGDNAEEPVVEETTIVDEAVIAPVDPDATMVEDETLVDPALTDVPADTTEPMPAE